MTTGDGIHRQRFALVMVLSLATVLLTIALPETNGTRAAELLIQGLALVVAVVAVRGHEGLRRQVGGVVLLLVIAAATVIALRGGADGVHSLSAFALALATPAVMVRGLAQLLREEGVVPQAVFGALALYLQFGLIFGFAAAGIGLAQGEPFFGGDAATPGEFVYWSFTTMSTTGYGDLTPATELGRSLAVLTMLVGQIYLVTVVGLLVGNIRRKRATPAG